MKEFKATVTDEHGREFTGSGGSQQEAQQLAQLAADNAPAPDVDRYFQYAVLHMLHRIWELQGVIALQQADNPDAVQQLIDKQQDNQYSQPFQW